MDGYGSWTLVSRVKTPLSPEFEQSFLERWEGLSQDVSKLNTDPFLNGATGSVAYCADTGETYKFVSETKTWYKQPTVGSSGGGNSGPDLNVAADSDVSDMLDRVFK